MLILGKEVSKNTRIELKKQVEKKERFKEL